MNLNIVGIIPARYSSSRFPGKPLADILGKPMIQWVYERSKLAKSLKDVYIATDDERIADTVDSFGGKYIMTSKNCKSGTDRIIEALSQIEEHIDIVVNIQGDEPLITANVIDSIVKPIIKNPDIPVSTAYTKINKKEEYIDEHIVKIVVNKLGYAIYFSRSPIPYMKEWKEGLALKHIGIYAYTTKFLMHLPSIASSLLEDTEKLEQLRILENGIPIKAVFVNYEGVGVDVKEDIEKVIKILKQQQSPKM